MKSIHLSEIVNQIGGTIVHGNEELQIVNATIFMQEIKDNVLYFHTGSKPPRLDWNTCRKYSFVIVTQQQDLGTVDFGKATVIRVPNLIAAYWKFVEFYRSQFDIPVYAVTGTCGKTTIKEMIKHMFEQRFNVQATHKSLNGSPFNLRYLMGINEDTDVAVFETCVIYPGDLLKSCRHFRPTIGILSNISLDHIEGCGTFEAYVKAKRDIAAGLGDQGTLILNRDDENIARMDLSAYRGNIITFGLDHQSDYWASDIEYAIDGMQFTLHHQGQTYPIYVPGYGKHMVYNALAALTATHCGGMPMEEATNNLRTFQHVVRHLQFRPGINGSILLDDTWHSNPKSMEAALETLQNLGKKRKKIAVLGFMDSLQDLAVYEHQKVGELIAKKGIDWLITLDELSKVTGEMAIKFGMNPKRIFMCENVQEATNILNTLVDQTSIVLVKSSMGFYPKELMGKISLQEK